jgi:nucleotide-binding universal stress UspA family protein
VRRARDAGVHATYLIWEGDPAEAILDAATAEGADVIMLGSRPRTNIRRLILGSVSSEVSKHATCEVVVIPT